MKGNAETLNYIRMHVQNVLIVAHDNGATLTVIVGSDECAMVTVNVVLFVRYGPQFLWD